MNYPNLPREAISSNAEAAHMAGENETVAVLTSVQVASHYGLHVVHVDVEDDPYNYTRLVVADNCEAGLSGHDQTSLILSVPNEAGAVYELLAPLAESGVSICCFRSRPACSDAWEYYFYVDVEGHQHDPQVARALEKLRHDAVYFKVLGSYPSAHRGIQGALCGQSVDNEGTPHVATVRPRVCPRHHPLYGWQIDFRGDT